ncbi:MAG TPA: molybdopterin-dependent oxidoreductase [Candidatus Dormibacteraeota bacterium]|nr:molybdopterin-dependent oxidoreductase [Candidatus Dormibacteraeota bacterium]
MSGPALGRRLFLAGAAGCLALVAAGGGVPAAVRSWLEGPLGELSPSDGFHFYSVTASIPRWERDTWRLMVDGLVARPQSLSLDQLASRELVTVTADFHCVSGWSVRSVRWDGVPVTDLLDSAGVIGGARAVRFESADGAYVDYLELATARREGVIIALRVHGAELSAERGAPARLVVPFDYGYKGVKWVRRLTAVPSAGTGYWEARGYDDDARIRH